MLVEKITSRQNPLLKRFRQVRAGSERHHIFLEGVRLIEDAVEAGAHFETVAFTSALETGERGMRLLDRLQKIPCRGAHVPPQLMQAIADTESLAVKCLSACSGWRCIRTLIVFETSAPRGTIGPFRCGPSGPASLRDRARHWTAI